VLAGCGGDSDGASSLDSVKVSSAKSPKVTVDKGYTTKTTVSKTLKSGSGDTLKTDDSVKINYVGVNGRTGSQFDSSFKTGSPLTITLNETSVLPGFIKGLKGKKVGSRVLVAIPPKDGFNADQEQLKLKKADTMVFLFDVVAKVPTEVTGTSKSLSKDLPKLKLDADNHPSGFTKTKTTAKKPGKQRAEVVIQGKGAKVKKGQTLTAQYVGQIYPAGKVFDESWSTGSRPFPVGAGAVIPCWDDLLVGQKLGSRVVLVCPEAYKTVDPPQGSTLKKTDDLLFVVDLLDAS
jgi:peptidylprolyl isomerase